VTEIKMKISEEHVDPRTLEMRPQPFANSTADATVWAVYGKDTKSADVWCCTFFDKDEAESWAQASKTFGRPVLGASVPTAVVDSDDAVQGP
jgi:hypothetical protein